MVYSIGPSLVNVSKDNPCPHCGKPDYCYFIGELSVCNRKNPPAEGWVAITKTDSNGHPYYAPIQEKKPIRPAQTRYWEYPARDGSPLVRVRRIDFGDGRKKDIKQEHWDGKEWVFGLAGIDRASIPIYRYQEVKEAVAKNQIIFIVEGEPCADLLWGLGLAATCNIGGSGKWRPSDSQDLPGAAYVICPDRDSPGIEHAEQIAKDFPAARWLYPYPDSGAWDNLPKSQGLDVADWIKDKNLTAADLMQSIEPKARSLGKPEQKENLVHFPIKNQGLPLDMLPAKIDALLDSSLTRTKLKQKFLELSQIFKIPDKEIRNFYKTREEEREQADNRAERTIEVNNLLSIADRRLTLEKYLHPSIAEPIKQLAVWMGVDAEAILTFLLPTVAGLINPNSCIVAKRCINFVEPFLLYTGGVALSGDRKTPTLNVVKSPLLRLQSAEDARYQQAMQIYESEIQSIRESKSKDKSESPQKPKPPREYYLDNVTVEAVDKIKGQQPDHGMTLIKDELSGLFASHGAYKGGKGSDKESYLSGWNGGGIKKNRAGDDSRVSLARDSLSITGGIQPDKLRELLGDFNDSQGEWARFLWYHMPSRPYKIPRDDRRFDMSDLLENLYRKIDALPAIELHFCKEGQTHFDNFYDKKDEQKLAENRSGLRTAIAKMPGQAVRLIGLLHVINNVAASEDDIPLEISLNTVQAGCKLADFYLGQVTLLQSSDVSSGNLSPIHKALVTKVREKGTLTARDAIASIRDLKKTSAARVRELFVDLAAMDLATVQGEGIRLTLKMLTSVDKIQNTPNPDDTRDVVNSNPKMLTNVDRMLTDSKQHQTHTEQGIQDVNYQNVDNVDTFFDTKNTLDCQKVELGYLNPLTIADKEASLIKSVNIVNILESTAESVTLQSLESADELSTNCVNISDSVNISKKPVVKIEAGDRVRVLATYPGSPELKGESATVDEVFEDGLLMLDFGRDLETTPPQRRFPMRREHLQLDPIASPEPIVPATVEAMSESIVPATVEATPEPIAPPVEVMPESIAPSLEPQPVPELIAPPTVEAVKKARKEFKVGGRVIVAAPDSKIYKGASGKIISTAGSGANQKYRVQFDKLVHNMASSIFKASELMSEPIAPASEELPKKP